MRQYLSHLNNLSSLGTGEIYPIAIKLAGSDLPLLLTMLFNLTLNYLKTTLIILTHEMFFYRLINNTFTMPPTDETIIWEDINAHLLESNLSSPAQNQFQIFNLELLFESSSLAVRS